MSEIKTWPGWRYVKRLGSGSYGVVNEIEKVEKGVVRKAALKIMSVPQEEGDIESLYDGGYARTVKEAETYIESQIKNASLEFEVMESLKTCKNIVEFQKYKIIPHQTWLGADILIRMELLSPLSKHIRKESLSVEEVCRLGTEMCNALQACHSQGVLHRDIKIENVMKAEDGTFKLGDFGVARVMEGTKSIHTKAGTEDYMAPEVLKGESYSATADIYSLGIMLYKLLNYLRSPFLPVEGSLTPELRENAKSQKLNGERVPAPLDGSVELKRAILKALEFTPSDRYQSANEFAEALRNCPEFFIFSHKEDIEQRTVKDVYVKPEQQEPPAVDISEADTVTLQQEPPVVDVFEENGTIKDSRSEQVIPPKKRRKPIALVFTALILVVCFCVSAVIYNYYSTTAVVPDLSNITYLQARDSLDDIGFTVAQRDEYSDTVEKGLVISVEQAGNRIKQGSEVLVHVSIGKLCQVPDLSDKSEKDASNTLFWYGLKENIEYEYSDEIEEGKVIRQTEVAGTLLTEGDIVTFVVSKGYKPFEMPNYIGSKYTDSKNAAEKLGLTVKKESQYSYNVPKGNVIQQSVKARYMVKKGDTIIFTVSDGIEQVEVPKLVGLSKSAAISKLENNGLYGNSSAQYDSDVEEGYVISQDTNSGTEVDKGSTVSFVVSLGKKPTPKVETTPAKNTDKNKDKNKDKDKADATWDNNSSSKNDKADATW